MEIWRKPNIPIASFKIPSFLEKVSSQQLNLLLTESNVSNEKNIGESTILEFWQPRL